MYGRSRVVGTGLGANSASRDPDERRGERDPLQSHGQGLERTPGGPARDTLGGAGQRSTGAYTLIAPNENRRHLIQRIAEEELANLEKWKQQNRAKPIHLVPRQLGGNQLESEVRQKQQLQLMQSKYQKKLKREESLRIKKEAEEAELQKMKAIQREKSNKLEEKKRLQENMRREAFREHHQYKTAEFLSRLDTGLPNRSACRIVPCGPQSSTWELMQPLLGSSCCSVEKTGFLSMSPSPCQQVFRPVTRLIRILREEENQKLQTMKDKQHQKNKLLEPKRQQQEEERAKIHQTEHRRVNNAFLDRLQGKSQPGGLEQSGGYWNMNSANSWDV